MPLPVKGVPTGPDQSPRPPEAVQQESIGPPTEAEATLQSVTTKAEGAPAISTEAPPSPPEPTPSAPTQEALIPVPSRPPAAPAHAESTIKGWFADTFNNLVATGRIREREAEAFLQDLLKRLGF